MYKVCNENACSDVDILAGFDAAIADGVDIISVSLGGPATYYNFNAIAIGSFHAMQKGIIVSCSARNNGGGGVENAAPWILTVAAASTDRNLQTDVQLGDGQILSGISVDKDNATSFPLINGTQAGLGSFCDTGATNKSKVKDKVLYCRNDYRQDQFLVGVGVKGIIFSDYKFVDVAFPFRVPASVVKFPDIGDKIDKYINSTKQPTALIHPTKVVNVKGTFVASFSSRGPQLVAPNLRELNC